MGIFGRFIFWLAHVGRVDPMSVWTDWGSAMTNAERATLMLLIGFALGGLFAWILHTPDCVMLPNWLAEHWHQSCI